MRKALIPWLLACACAGPLAADNGNGTYTNPLFWEDFPDPDLIRVGNDFYLTGSTMHMMPGLPILHSRDLVNWEFLSYASAGLDFGPEYRLEGDANIYGRGIWAPSLRHHNGTFHVFANVNGRGTQVYTATDPRGPWRHHEMKRSLHDLSVLFDDDGKVYAIWGYEKIMLAELNAGLTDIVPGTERVIIGDKAGMGEGSHLYKIRGKYVITSARWDGRMRMPAARADRIDGPYEVNPAISADEDFGLAEGNRVRGLPPFLRVEAGPGRSTGANNLHQGGIVDTPDGQWWGFTMGDANSAGRMTHLSPVTWQDGWPWFGLPGNLGRTPRTWVKPIAGQAPRVPFQRDDDFSGPALQPAWQWNHYPDNSGWSLAARPGHLRLHAARATSLLQAKHTLAQHAPGPASAFSALVDGSGMMPGAIGGIALLGVPYAYLGIERTAGGYQLSAVDQSSGHRQVEAIAGPRIWLKAEADFLNERAQFSYAADGRNYRAISAPARMAWQLTTFQGVRYALFTMAQTAQAVGSHLDIDEVRVAEARANAPIPAGETITLAFDNGQGLGDVAGQPAAAAPLPFTVVPLPLGRVALRHGAKLLSVQPDGATRYADTVTPGPAESFQWMTTLDGDLLLMSLATNRYLRLAQEGVRADSPGAGPSREARLHWRTVKGESR